MAQSKYIHKSHNVSLLLYQIVCPAKYRRVVFSESVDITLKEICIEISKRYQIYFLEIGTDDDHVHFLVQSVPMYSPTKIVTIIKSITAREIFSKNPEVKKQLWGGEFWTDGYFINDYFILYLKSFFDDAQATKSLSNRASPKYRLLNL